MLVIFYQYHYYYYILYVLLILFWHYYYHYYYYIFVCFIILFWHYYYYQNNIIKHKNVTVLTELSFLRTKQGIWEGVCFSTDKVNWLMNKIILRLIGSSIEMFSTVIYLLVDISENTTICDFFRMDDTTELCSHWGAFMLQHI